ncbi:MAG TPA: hypothetical protein VGG30_01975, partial [Pirellulales bacterium]
MAADQWTAVDAYFTDLVVKPDAALDAAIADSQAAGFPPVHVSPPLGKLLHQWARMVGARRILE